MNFAVTPGTPQIHFYENPGLLKKKDAKKLSQILNERYLKDPKMKFLIAPDEEGTISGVLAYRQVSENGLNFFALKEIFVEKECRNQGIGKELMSAFESIAGDTLKQLVVLATNMGAIRFYRRLGYEILNDPSSQVIMGKE